MFVAPSHLVLQPSLHRNHADPSPSHQTQVKAIIQNVTIASMQTYLTALTAFNNRYYKSTTGVDATNWIVKTAGDVHLIFQYTSIAIELTDFPDRSQLPTLPAKQQ